MKFLKFLASVLALALSLTVIVWCGYFLWRALSQKPSAPVMLRQEQLQQALREETPPAPEAPAEEPPAEEPPAEEPPAEEPPVEEPPAVILPEPVPVPEKDPAHEAAVQLAREYLSSMSLEEKLWQLFIVAPEALAGESTEVTQSTGLALMQKPVGGVVCFGENLKDREQTTALLSGLQGYAWTPLFVAVEEEGGVVSRVGANSAMGAPHLPAAATYGESGDADALRADAGALAAQLKELGFNVDFAPVADIITNSNNTEIGNRAYSADPQIAADLVGAMVEGLEETGVASCLKHFPGHGSTEADSHEGKSVSTRTVEELRQSEWVPFTSGIDAGASFVMVGHQTNENLSAFPASLSPVVMTYLRAELGFDGIIITDSLQMGAIVYYYTSAQAAVMAIQAGADMLLMPNDLQTAFDGLKAAVNDGTLTEKRIDESVLRILTEKFEMGIMK